MQTTNIIYIAITPKKGNIRNTRNNQANKHENFQYIFDLFLSVITVSVKTA